MEEEMSRPNYKDLDGFTIPGAFSPDSFRSVFNYVPKPGDLFIVTYPKCGTTWTQFIVMLILRKGKPFENEGEFHQSSPFLELTGADAIDYIKGKGTLKIHLPLNLAPFSPEAKYIYIARNPRDCCVSFYHHTRNLPLYNFEDGTFDEYFELFINGKTDYGDYFDHLLPWYERRDDPNVYFTTYEDLKKDIRVEILKLAKFVGEEHYERLKNNPEELDDVIEHSSLDSMKKIMNDKSNSLINRFGENGIPKDAPVPSGIRALYEYAMRYPTKGTGFKGDFVRKGIVGDWKNHCTPEQEMRMEEWIKRRTEGSDVMRLWSCIDF